MRFYAIFNGINYKNKGLPIENTWRLLLRIFEVLQTTLGRNPTSSFRNI